jgi:CrcB protein
VNGVIIASVVIAGSIGAVLRYLATRLVAADHFPTPVLLVNAIGSLAAGVLLALSETAMIDPELSLVLLTGFCGGLTTFSTLSVESIQLIRDDRTRIAIASITANLVLGIGAALAGYLVTYALV